MDANAVYKPTNADVLYVYGDADEFYRLEKFQAFERKLKNYLPQIEIKIYAAKHEITEAMRADIGEWLKKLSTENRD